MPDRDSRFKLCERNCLGNAMLSFVLTRGAVILSCVPRDVCNEACMAGWEQCCYNENHSTQKPRETSSITYSVCRMW